MDRGSCFAGFGVEFAPVSKPKELFSGRSEKIMPTPRLGDARRAFRCHYSGAIWNSRSHLISDTRCGLSWSPPRRGIEVLVSYALNPIELTNRFLRFPRVRQQTRGNFSFQNLLRIFIIGGARFVIRFPH